METLSASRIRIAISGVINIPKVTPIVAYKNVGDVSILELKGVESHTLGGVNYENHKSERGEKQIQAESR